MIFKSQKGETDCFEKFGRPIEYSECSWVAIFCQNRALTLIELILIDHYVCIQYKMLHLLYRAKNKVEKFKFIEETKIVEDV